MITPDVDVTLTQSVCVTRQDNQWGWNFSRTGIYHEGPQHCEGCQWSLTAVLTLGRVHINKVVLSRAVDEHNSPNPDLCSSTPNNWWLHAWSHQLLGLEFFWFAEFGASMCPMPLARWPLGSLDMRHRNALNDHGHAWAVPPIEEVRAP